MSAKRGLVVLLSVVVIAGIAAALKPDCPRVEWRPSPAAGGVASRPRTAEVDDVTQPHDGIAPVFAIRRNLFAFVHVPAPVLPRAVTPAVQLPAPVAQTPHPAEPEFLYRYIGRFGPDANPIAVFAANGDIVNARVGDFLAGQFRLSAIGIESVDVTSASGAVRRVSLRP